MKAEIEVWRDVIGYEGLYKVSNLGRVKSCSRLKSNKWGSYLTKELIMSPSYNAKGYVQIGLSRDGFRNTRKVHRLVLEAFEGCGEGLQANHKNKITKDNRLSNLEWTTPSQNVVHSFQDGSRDHRGSNHAQATLKEAQVRQIRELHGRGVKIKEICQSFQLKYHCVWNIVNRRSWVHI